jgi:hypothetical protein
MSLQVSAIILSAAKNPEEFKPAPAREASASPHKLRHKQLAVAMIYCGCGGSSGAASIGTSGIS